MAWLKSATHYLLEAAFVVPLALLNGLTSRRGYRIDRSRAYGPLARHRLDLYVPDGAAETAPVVVFFHGGSWDSGSKDLYTFVGQSLVTAAWTVAIPNYRLHPEVVFPDFVEDAAEAVAWVAANVAGARRPLFVLGHSAGAHIALLLALDPHYLKDTGSDRGQLAGVVGLSGPYDFLPLREQRYKDVFPEAVRPASQPIAFVDTGTPPPLLLAHGNADGIVLPRNSTGLADAVRQRGGRADVRLYDGIGHLGTLAALARLIRLNDAPVRADIIAFVEDVVGTSEEAPTRLRSERALSAQA